MKQQLLLKFAVAAILVGIVVIRWPEAHDVFTIAVLAFGLVNVFVELPGTFSVRATTVVATLPALAMPSLKIVLAIGAWLLWLPAFTAAHAAVSTEEKSAVQARIAATAIITAVAIGSVAYRLLFAHHLDQTAALFVGLPAIIAVVVVYTVSPESATGVALKAVSIGLLVSLTMLWEGILCVLMSAPIFLAVAVAVAQGIEAAQRQREHSRLYSCLVLLVIVPFTLEGVTPFTTIDRRETVTASKIVMAPAADVAQALLDPPRFERLPSRYLRIGFPQPTTSRIECHTGRLRWIVQIRGGEMRINGMEPRIGDLTFELA